MSTQHQVQKVCFIVESTPRRMRPAIACAFALCLSLAACGEAPEKVVPVAPANGKVTFKSEKLEGAKIVFHPSGHELPPGKAASAIVKADGTFSAGIYGDGSGIPPGDYVATVVFHKIVGGNEGSGRGPNILPKRYASSETSPLKVTVTDGTNQLETFELTEK